MPEMNRLLDDTFQMKAAETTLYQYCVAALDTATAGQCKRPAGDTTDVVAGVLVDTELAAEKVGNFVTHGRTKLTISAAVAVGDKLVIGAVTGRVRPAVNPTDAGMPIVAIALTAATTAGSRVVGLLTQGAYMHS